METATRRREKESEDLQNNRPKSLCINLSQILPLFLVLLSGKWLQSGRHKAMGSPLLREYDIKVSLFSFSTYPFIFSSSFLTHVSIFICLLTYFYTLLFLYWSMFPHVIHIVYFSYVFQFLSLSSWMFYLPQKPSFVKLQFCVYCCVVSSAWPVPHLLSYLASTSVSPCCISVFQSFCYCTRTVLICTA